MVTQQYLGQKFTQYSLSHVTLVTWTRGKNSSFSVISGIFHLQKISENFYWKFPLGKSAFHLSQVPVEGAEEGLAAQKTAKGMELVIRREICKMEHKFSIGKFAPGKRDYLFTNSDCSGNFQWTEPKSRVLFTSQPEFPEFFGKWKTLISTQISENVVVI